MACAELRGSAHVPLIHHLEPAKLTSPCALQTPNQLGGRGRALNVSTQTDHQWCSYRDKMDGGCPAESPRPHLQRYQLGRQLWSLIEQDRGSFPRACGPAAPKEAVPVPEGCTQTCLSHLHPNDGVDEEKHGNQEADIGECLQKKQMSHLINHRSSPRGV